MKRRSLMLALVLAAPLLMGAGGQAPPPEVAVRIVGPAISGTLVLDPHQDTTVTPMARRAALVLRKGTLSASAVFDAAGTYQCGCDLALTALRFQNQPLTQFLSRDKVTQLLAELGVSVPTSRVSGIPGVPIISDVSNDACTGDRNPDGTFIQIDPGDTGQCQVPGATLGPNSDPIAGVLSVDVVVQFEVIKE